MIKALWNRIYRPPWRPLVIFGFFILIVGFAYLIWSPGSRFQDGRHDRGRNAMWLQHGWLGDDIWFKVNDRDKSRFRNDEKLQALAEQLKSHGISGL